MLSLWILYLLLPLSSPLSLHAVASTGENVKETQHADVDAAAQHLPQPLQSLSGSSLVTAKPLLEPVNLDFLGLPLSWPLSSSEESDRQGVIGEYVDILEGTETSLLYPYEDKVFTSTKSAAEDVASTQPKMSPSGAAPPQPTEEQVLKYQSAETSTDSILYSTAAGDNRLTLPSLHNETTESRSPFLLSGSLRSETEGQDSTSPQSAGQGLTSDYTTPLVATDMWGKKGTLEDTVPMKKTGDGLVNITNRGGAVGMEAENDDSKDRGLKSNMNTSATPCKTTNQSWTPTYPDDFTPNESLHPSLGLSPALYVPLYSDWNSALATWGFAWEAHIYGLGSVFTVFGLISVVCLLGLPLRCPPGSPYFALLHLFLLAFEGIQAFCLLYDAYSHQDRLPPIGSLLLSELPFPCLVSAFSLAFLLLSLRSRLRLSLPAAMSSSLSVLPKPRLLLCVSLLHFAVSLGCVGMLQLFHTLPNMILLFPHGLFVCLTIFLSFSYLIFYCLIRIDTKHIYRLSDNGESGGSPQVRQPASCPFAKVEDWYRAAGAGVGAALCMLGCGGLQLYAILHALGLGGVDGYGFQPWSWWGYQVGCRLCEIGVCLSLSLIGTHPLFCQNNSSIKTTAEPRPGSWSRLSCSSPSLGLTLPSHECLNSPVLSSHDPCSQCIPEKLATCNVISKIQSEALPLCSIVDLPGNGLECLPKSNQIKKTLLPLPTPPVPPHRPINAGSQVSSLDSLGLETDSTVDLRPPSPIDLSRSIDQALFSDSLFSHSIFGFPKLFSASSSHSLSSPSHVTSKHGPSSVEKALYRTSSCGDMDQDKTMTSSRCSQAQSSLTSQSRTVEQWDWKGSVSGSTQGLCSNPREPGKLRSHSWANRGQHFAQHSIPRAIPHLSYHRRYRTLSLASRESQGSGRLAGTKKLSESKQLEWDAAVQAEFVNVCRQIDDLSVCSDTIEL